MPYHSISGHYRDSAQDVIYAPLDGERVITKGIYYVNAKSPNEDKIYSSILENRVESVDGVDPFFITRPPTRTTVSVKYSVVDTSPPRRSSDDNDVAVVVEETKSTMRTKAPLRLVTFPPSSTTPLPPFKHVIFQRRPPNTRQTPENTVSTSAIVSNDREFPPAPWHMPPLIPIPQGRCASM
ncbi:unnamed protein product [Heligmosomoides polygyrus]|uniref:Cadherin domain-containing protein n=1 Tax=Heligmosomoides polygyrus TaxID=6339 RepID=A0A183GB78_HELPZ|nr:unnamed protein product [Heligmosomoides polygyrus]